MPVEVARVVAAMPVSLMSSTRSTIQLPVRRQSPFHEATTLPCRHRSPVKRQGLRRHGQPGVSTNLCFVSHMIRRHRHCCHLSVSIEAGESGLNFNGTVIDNKQRFSSRVARKSLRTTMVSLRQGALGAICVGTYSLQQNLKHECTPNSGQALIRHAASPVTGVRWQL